jgi:hypothetical protein
MPNLVRGITIAREFEVRFMLKQWPSFLGSRRPGNLQLEAAEITWGEEH